MNYVMVFSVKDIEKTVYILEIFHQLENFKDKLPGK